MPRKRKTLTGADAQDIKSVPGQRYGEGVDQQAMQRAMPAPDGMQASVPSVEIPEMQAQPTSRAAGPESIAEFLSSNNPGLLSQPGSDRPVTSGLPTGPGPGPEILRLTGTQSPLARQLLELSKATGSPVFERLAQRAGMI